jgi:Subtilisin-like serine proteases
MEVWMAKNTVLKVLQIPGKSEQLNCHFSEMKVKTKSFTLSALAFGILLSAYTDPANGQRPTTPATPTPVRSRTGVRVPKRPVAKVLVALKGDYKLEGELDKAAITAQRNAIATAQARVIKGIKAETSTKRNPTASARVRRRYVTVPGLALELKPELVEDLKRLPDVAAVYEDKLNDLALDSTTRLIGSRIANDSIFGVDGTGQVVAVLDTGIFRGHQFLGTSRFVANACFSSSSWFSDDEQTLCPNGEGEQFGGNSARNCNISGCEHGTHVAGIVGGFRDDNNNGLVDIDDFKGVAPRVKFVAMQIFHRVNNEDVCGGASKTPCIKSSDGDIIAGLDRVELVSEDHPIAAVNLSVGGGEYRGFCDENVLMKWAIDDLRSREIATVVASGNSKPGEGRPRAALASPACISSAISVGNTQDDDDVSATSFTSDLLSLLAPGTNVCSSVPGSGSACDGVLSAGFAPMNGTSMAAPHVAGLWALMKQRRSSVGQSTSVGAIRNQLRDTGVDVTEDGVTTPRVDAVKALELKSVVILTSFDRIDLADAMGGPRTVTLSRRNFSGSLDLVPTIQSGNPGDLRISFSSDPTTADNVSMTIIPELFAYGRYILNLTGTASGVGVIPKQLTVNVLPPTPTITGFSPASGHLTTWVTITGQNFSRLTEVEFRGSNPIHPVVDSSTSIRVQVPVGATSGPLRVSNLSHSDDSRDWFFVTPDPVITRVSPNHAPVGTPVVVNGFNFNPINTVTVRINDVTVTGLTVTTTQLSFNIPQTTSGAHNLRVATSRGNATTNFTVGYPVPTLSDSIPQVGLKGGTITLSGSGFYSPVKVSICSKFATFTILSANGLRVSVPEQIENTCPVTVTTFGGTITRTQSFLDQ